jgi:hypothetical protein
MPASNGKYFDTPPKPLSSLQNLQKLIDPEVDTIRLLTRHYYE